MNELRVIGNDWDILVQMAFEPYRLHTLLGADHCMGNDLRGEKSRFDANDTTVLPQNHIPLIIYAPAIFKPKVVRTVGSQADMLPTIADLLGWPQPFSTVSASLLDPAQAHFAYLSAADISSLTNGSATVTYNNDVFLESMGDTNATSRLKQQLLGIDTALPYLLKHNRWYRAK